MFLEGYLLDGAVDQEDLPTMTLCTYNMIREKAKMPPAAIDQEIDADWFYNFYKAFKDLEVMDTYGYQVASFEEQKMLSQAARIIKLDHEVVAVLKEGRFGSAAQIITLPGQKGMRGYVIYNDEPDRDIVLHFMFHELGHIKHNDSMSEVFVKFGLIGLPEILQKDHIKSTSKNSRLYLELGMKLLPFLARTVIGRRLTEYIETPQAQEALQT